MAPLGLMRLDEMRRQNRGRKAIELFDGFKRTPWFRSGNSFLTERSEKYIVASQKRQVKLGIVVRNAADRQTRRS